MLKIKNSPGSYRSLSQIFTPANFKRIIKSSEYDSVYAKINLHIENFQDRTYSDVFEIIYKGLEKNYRNEYLYKNTLLIKKLINEYGVQNSVVLNEFKLEGSIADFVLINGEVKIFEIKTDLDSFDKLAKQILDYKKFANKIYVVVSPKNTIKILELYKDTNIGIIELTKRNNLKTIKEAKEDTSFFDHTVIFKTLRKQEYLEIIADYFGFIPDVPNTQIFERCLKLSYEIEISNFQKLAYLKLKERKLKCSDILNSEIVPQELKYICYTSNFNKKDYDKLFTFLKTPL